jgi:hypothetical protein
MGDLLAAVAYWQSTLRLLDWRIDARYVPDLCNGVGAPVYGLCSYLADNKTATILVRDPSTPIDGAEPKTLDEIVSHEVSHLHFAPFGAREAAEVMAEENAVWAFSEALAQLKGTPQGAALARAMATHKVPVRRSAAAVCRKGQPMNKVELAALKAAMAGGEDGLKAFVKEMEGLVGDDAPPSERAEGQTAAPPPADAKPAEAMPEAKAAEAEPRKDEKPEAKPALALSDVRREARAAVAEATQRSALIAQNRGRMTDAQAVLFEGLPLPALKAQIAALPPAATSRDAKPAIGPQAPPGGAGAADADPRLAMMLEHVDRRMGVQSANVEAVTTGHLGELRISHMGGKPVQRGARAASEVSS